MVSKLAGELNGTKVMSTSQNSTLTAKILLTLLSAKVMRLSSILASLIFSCGFGCASLYKQSAYLPSVVQLQNGILLMIQSKMLKLKKRQTVADDYKMVGVSVAHSGHHEISYWHSRFWIYTLTIVKLAKWWLAYLAMELKRQIQTIV